MGHNRRQTVLLVVPEGSQRQGSAGDALFGLSQHRRPRRTSGNQGRSSVLCVARGTNGRCDRTGPLRARTLAESRGERGRSLFGNAVGVSCTLRTRSRVNSSMQYEATTFFISALASLISSFRQASAFSDFAFKYLSCLSVALDAS